MEAIRRSAQGEKRNSGPYGLQVRAWVALVWILGTLCSASPGNAQEEFGTTEEEMKERLKELEESASVFPENEFLIYSELDRLGEEIGAYTSLREELAGVLGRATELDSVRNAAEPVLRATETANCAKMSENQATQLRAQITGLRRRISMLYDEPLQQDPWRDLLLRAPDVANPVTTCTRVQTWIRTSGGVQSLLGFFDVVRRQMEQERTSAQARSETLGKLLQRLTERRSALRQRLASRSTQQQIGENLWLVILAIGALSLSAILTVTRFSEKIQEEWVASGQVIQFVTVMILLSVLMALGLSNILKEETLGTLLGAVAGYVLSQGVGRATARELSRALQTPPPGSPPARGGDGANAPTPSGPSGGVGTTPTAEKPAQPPPPVVSTQVATPPAPPAVRPRTESGPDATGQASPAPQPPDASRLPLGERQPAQESEPSVRDTSGRPRDADQS